MKKTLTPAVLPTTAQELKLLIASAPVPAYVIGARARVNPMKLSRLVRGHDPLTKDFAQRLARAVEIEKGLHGR